MVVRMRHTRSQTRQRRSHHALSTPRLSTCAHCGEMHVRHTMCEHCGYYRGKQIIDVAAIRARTERRQKDKLKAMGKATSGPAKDTEEKKQER